jgi:hypothetical protein
VEQDHRVPQRLIHGYWSVDLLLVWDVVENDLPLLKDEVHRLLAALSARENSSTSVDRSNQRGDDGDITLRPQRANLLADRWGRRGLPSARREALLRACATDRRHGAVSLPDRSPVASFGVGA